MGTRRGLRGGDGRPGNPVAITGFVASLVMWIPIHPAFNFVLWIVAVVTSIIGLRRCKTRGLRHKGLAIAGLCISFLIAAFILLVGLLWAGSSVIDQT